MYLIEGINDKNLFKAVFMAGSAGSGKSYIAGNIFASKVLSPLGVKIVDSDKFFEYGLKKAGLPLTINASIPNVYKQQMDVRDWAKQLTASKQAMYINGMLPLVIDGTGRDFDKIRKQSEILRSVGYDTSLVLVNTSLEVALQRNSERERKVDVALATKMWHDVQDNIGKFQRYFGNTDFYVVDNSEYHSAGTPEAQEFDLSLFKLGKKLIESPLKNLAGLEILKKLKETGGKYLTDLV